MNPENKNRNNKKLQQKIKCVPTPANCGNNHIQYVSKMEKSEMINAFIYILSGIYVIFILDVFVRMGTKL
jgi:hypothetical protein